MVNRGNVSRLVAVLVIVMTAGPIVWPAPVQFTKVVIDKTFRSEGVAVGDVNGNGWIDSIVTTMMGKPGYWYENPKNQSGHWKVHIATSGACNETPLFVDLLGTGRPVPVWGVQPEGYMAWFSIPEDPYNEWTMHEWHCRPQSLGWQELTFFVVRRVAGRGRPTGQAGSRRGRSV